MSSYTVTRADGTTVQPGDTITDFRGDAWTFEQATRASTVDKSGLVAVSRPGETREFYSTVFKLTVTAD